MSSENDAQPTFRLRQAAACLCAGVCLGVWAWGAILYFMAGDAASAGGAIVLAPIGILHGIGAI
jgi:hypothetical protein